ncbi:MAG TPA: DUF72 domain-containing protein [Thermoanaerobaculia bacterium]|nr:DUF72 domain-containing protein [Thermoanaerobaculia bacterium]
MTGQRPAALPGVRVGTAGWMYKDWEGIVYPPPRRGFDRLGFMASLFDADEINSTFYRIPPASMARDWARRVAHNPRFLFTAKLYRGFTHDGNATAEDEKAVRDAMDALASAERLGAVLVQVPMSFRATEENRATLERIFGRFAAFPLAAEFRHFSWNSPETLRFLEDNSVGFVNIDQPRLKGNLPATSHVTGPVAYYRFHGRNAAKWFGPDTSNEERYNYLYNEKELTPWVERIRERGERAPKSNAFAVMNNHFRGQAVANALQLQQMLTGEVRSAPDSLRETYPALAPITTPQTRKPEQPRLF